uniref:Uncharacterized protein n=2 Tax=Caudoviricetes TaxID=2731619 RepID=A0A8S5R9R8_9CAUD|nr:MAG TPA: hypothetical protein [Siphoviridae sp. ctkfT29]DAH19614.1 MAG TPA: hypothetical protein [Caudoviricetes sp.]DAH34245.1 MAG TPA: hypothetical protein [Caudoviricetes sp.]
MFTSCYILRKITLDSRKTGCYNISSEEGKRQRHSRPALFLSGGV